MKIGLIDVDGHSNFPNIPLMKISEWHKEHGDDVEFVIPVEQKHYDKVYMSKVFSFTNDYPYYVDADEIIRGGTGYCIELVDGKEVYHKENDIVLPEEVEHIYPDYSLYGITNTAYGFLTRGCPRGCDFCVVGKKEGRCSRKVSDLKEFWNGQSHIELLDPNMFACKEWGILCEQLIESKAKVNFSQGVDIRLLTEEQAKALTEIKIDKVHFAWDRYKDKESIIPKLEMFKRISEWDRRKMIVYVLTNFDTTFEQDIERVNTLRELGYYPYVMIYDKKHLQNHDIQRLQRWVNNRWLWESCERFEDFKD